MKFTGFEQYLKSGETILWQGVDEKGDLPPAKVLIGLAAGTVVCGVNAFMFKVDGNESGMILFGVIAVLMFAAAVLSIIMRKSFNRHYAITQTRLFSFRTLGYGENAGFSAYDISEVIVPLLSPIDADGLYKVTFKGVREMRIQKYAVRHQTYKETVAIPLEFVNVRDGKKIVNLVNDIMSQMHGEIPEWHAVYKEAYKPEIERADINADDPNTAYNAMFTAPAKPQPQSEVTFAQAATAAANYRGYVKEQKQTSIPTKSRSELPSDVQAYILDSFDERIYWYGDAKRKLGIPEILLSVTALVVISAIGIGMVIANGITPSTIATLFIDVMTVIFFFVYTNYAYGAVNCVISNASVKIFLPGQKRKTTYVALRKATYAVPLGSDGVFIYFDEKGRGKREMNAFARANLEMRHLAVALCGLSEYQQYEVIKAVEAAVEDI